ncbi:hypothetical protein FAES_3940 [Fibrella aestuarina BUZ 2]|uniref:Uncharacterized protein n=1 Tax=Fibrella aestuarina BUZ 2 TaxID=1166018 RepID=I0KCU3_9BACT|nr:hypothetical protein FAES_3940 [Fibrella aestuarina BUZ 2]
MRFERRSLRHDNRGRSPAYQLFLTREACDLEVEAAELRSLMSRTDFVNLPFETQRAIKAILEA